MLRRRMIDPTIWADEHFGKLSDKAKILFIACISNADDEGRLSAHTSNLRALAFRFSDTPLSKIQEIRNEVAENIKNFIVYSVNGCEYIQLKKWGTYQTIREDRKVNSSFPNVNQMSTKCGDFAPKVKESKVKESKVYIPVFSLVWSKYPNKDGRKEAERYFKATVHTEQDFKDINTALDNYLKHLSLKSNEWKRPKNGSTWFNNWKDWLDWIEPKGKELEDALPDSLKHLA